MTAIWDAVVVGARVAGAATALQLAAAGQRVLCVDRARRGSDTLSTHALMRGGVLLLGRWGVLRSVAASGTPAIRHTVFDYGTDRVEVSIKAAAGVDALYAPRRTVLDAALAEAAERAGAAFEFGSTVTGLHRSAGGVVDGVLVTRQGRTRLELARLVIGADGRGSMVAHQTGTPTTAFGTNAAAYLYGYWSGLPARGYEWLYRPGLSAGVIPTSDGLTCVFVAGRPGDVAAAVRDHGGPRAAYRRLAGRLGLADRFAAAGAVESVRYVRSLPPGFLRPTHGAGWALVGDSGHWLDPMSTHGMTSALRDASLLGHALAGTDHGSSARADALAGYQITRDRLSLPMLRASDEIAGHRWDLQSIRPLLRAMSSAMTDEVEALQETAAA